MNFPIDEIKTLSPAALKAAEQFSRRNVVDVQTLSPRPALKVLVTHELPVDEIKTLSPAALKVLVTHELPD